MWQVIAFLILAAVLFAVFKLALILLIIAGLIFRTKETLTLLAIGGVMNLFILHPVAGIVGTVSLLGIGAYLKSREDTKEQCKEAATLALPAPDAP